MASRFPEGFDNFTNPTGVTALDTSARWDHGQQHSDLNDAVEALQRSLGIAGVACRNAGVTINALTSATNIAWSGTTGATGGVDNTFPGLDGENTLWIECPIASGGVGYARAILTQNQRFASTDSVSVRVKVEKASSLRFVQLQVVQGAIVLSNSTTTDGTFEAGEHGWYTITWKLSDFSVTGGSADYGSDFTSFRFQIGAAGTGGALGKIAVSQLRKNPASEAYLLFANDSSYDDVWDIHKYFAASGIPLNINVNAALLDSAGYLTAVQAAALKNHVSGVFCLSSYPTYKPSLSHTATGIAASQAVGGAGNLTLNGSLCSAGTANLGAPRKVVLSGSAVSRTIMFTITGTLAGVAKSEVILGPAYAAGLVESNNYYDTVTQIAVSGAISGTCTVGTSYSVAELAANIEANASGMRALGLGGDEYHVAYSGGQISGPLYAAMVSVGAKTGRTTYHSQAQPRNHLPHDAAFNPYLLSGVNLGTAIATLKSMIDDLESRGGVLVCYFHTIAATVDGVNPTAEHFAEILAYSKAKARQGKLSIVSYRQLQAMLNSRTTV